jgi:hypothetical protein
LFSGSNVRNQSHRDDDQMKRLLLIFALLCGSAFGTTYFAPTSAGSNNGTDCADAYAIGDVAHGINVSGNWTAGNTIHVCSGTYTGSAGSTLITAAGSGSSGNPINLYLDPGAVLTAPYWAAGNGAINISGQSWITVDGWVGHSCGFVNAVDVTCGGAIIENSANGSKLANQQNSRGVFADPCQNCIVRGINFQNLYVHTLPQAVTSTTIVGSGNGATITINCTASCLFPVGAVVSLIQTSNASINSHNGCGQPITITNVSPSTQVTGTINSTFCGLTPSGSSTGGAVAEVGISNSQVNAVYFSGQNTQVCNNWISNSAWAIIAHAETNDTGIQICHNHIDSSDHTVAYSPNNETTAYTAYIYGNHFTNFMNWDSGCGPENGACSTWDTGSNNYHHDGIHFFDGGVSVSYTMFIYNNVCDGTIGVNATGCYFAEGTTSSNLASTTYYFNNVAVSQPTNTSGQGHTMFVGGCLSGGSTRNCFVYNNTVLSAANASDVAYDTSGTDALFKNNAAQSSGSYLQWNNWTITTPSTDIDYNAYADNGQCGGNGCWNWGAQGIDASSLAAWKSACVCDSHGVYAASLGINSSTYVPTSTGSLVYHAGVNLTSVCSGQPSPGLGDLCSDAAGVARPNSAWDVGAFQFGVTVTVATPTLSLAAGSYANAQTTICATSTPGASCVYTADGTTPTVSGTTCTVTNGNLAPNNYVLPVSQSVTIAVIGCLSGDTASSTVSAAYTITYSSTIAASNFGLQCGFSNGACKNPSPPPLVLWPTSIATPSVVRMLSSNTDWATMQPNSSGIVYTDLDGYLDALAATALVSGNPAAADEVFISVPCYLAAAPTPCPTASQPAHGTNSPPADLVASGSPSFNAFVTAFVNHCSVAGNCVKNLIKYYEMWNEPNLPYSWAGTELQLEQMIAPAAQIIAANVPNAVIMTPSFSSGGSGYTTYASNWLTFENTVGPFSSIVLLHDYLGTSIPESRGPPGAFATAVHGVAGWSNALLGNDETNWAASNNFKCVGYSTADCIGQIVRWQLIQASKGYAAIWWFVWNGTIGNGPVGYASAYYWAEQYLIGGHFTGAASGTGTPPVWTAPFVEGNGKTALWVWTTSESGTTYTVPSNYTDYRDISGGSTPITAGNSIAISVQPIMLEQGTSVLPPATVNAAIALLAQN